MADLSIEDTNFIREQREAAGRNRRADCFNSLHALQLAFTKLRRDLAVYGQSTPETIAALRGLWEQAEALVVAELGTKR